MAWRTFSIFLLSLNVAAFAFAWFNPIARAPLPKATEGNIAPLVLLSERDEAQMRALRSVSADETIAPDVNTPAAPAPASVGAELAAETATAPLRTSNPVDAQYCERVGPLNEIGDANSLRARLGAISTMAEVVAKDELALRGYWVYLGASADRDTALTRARQLSAAGIRDYYVVTEGDNENTISLGMFRDAVNADKRVREINALGFDAKRIERGDKETRYWVEYQAASANKVSVANMRGMAQLRRETMFCKSDLARATPEP
jgi:hypothetical protein